jgi:hypothetical protein
MDVPHLFWQALSVRPQAVLGHLQGGKEVMKPRRADDLPLVGFFQEEQARAIPVLD